MMTESEFPTEFASGWKDMTQPELDESMRLHHMFKLGQLGGKRANLSFRNLSYRDLSNHDLSDADFSGCRAQHPNFRRTNLSAANLFAAHLRSPPRPTAIPPRAAL